MKATSPGTHIHIRIHTSGQSSTVGMLPPSDSETDSEGEEKKPPGIGGKQAEGGQKSNVGKLPPSDSDSDSSSDSDGPAMNDYLTAPRQPKK